jgi:hypothetical protein
MCVCAKEAKQTGKEKESARAREIMRGHERNHVYQPRCRQERE